MAVTVNNMSDSAGIVNYATGQLTTDAGAAAALVLQLGFLPRYFRIVGITGGNAAVTEEWFEGMGANSFHTIASGTKTVLSTGQITVGTGATERQVTLAAALVPVSSTLVWEAQG